MALIKYDKFNTLNDSKTEWRIRVRAQSIWKGITRSTGEFRGYNILLFDDSSERIHAFISAQLAPKFEDELDEGDIFTVENFKVNVYNGDETSRAVRYEKHIYFTAETIFKKNTSHGLPIPYHSFDLFRLQDLESMKTDNRYLTDVLGVIHDVPERINYTKGTDEKSHVQFTITDGKKSVKVTFFNAFGELFLNAKEKCTELPIIIVIGSGKISEYKGEVYITNFPATRFYLNLEHHSVKALRERLKAEDFYQMDVEEEVIVAVPIIKVTELRNLKPDFDKDQVCCQVKLNKIDEKRNWFSEHCTGCGAMVKFVDDEYKCSGTNCGRVIPWPDKRFSLYTLCSDSTGTIPIIWPNNEIVRLTGKTVYDVEVDEEQVGDASKFPPLLKNLEKKNYQITIHLTKSNIKEGCGVFNATSITEALESSATHSPAANGVPQVTETVLPNEIHATPGKESNVQLNSPPTITSTNKSRPRNTDEVVKYNSGKPGSQPKLKSIKIEKV